MEFSEITSGRRRYMDLLLLADEQANMVERYLDRGRMWIGSENGRVLCCAVVTDEGGGVFELKNLAVAPQAQRRGLGRSMVEHICRQCPDSAAALIVGTGDVPGTAAFYRKCGFVYTHRIPGFFTENYDHPIIEDGQLLRDMVYFRRTLQK